MSVCPFRSVLPAITTPLRADDSVDHEFLARHARWQLDEGCAGLIPLGSLGEGATLQRRAVYLIPLLESLRLPRQILDPIREAVEGFARAASFGLCYRLPAIPMPSLRSARTPNYTLCPSKAERPVRSRSTTEPIIPLSILPMASGSSTPLTNRDRYRST